MASTEKSLFDLYWWSVFDQVLGRGTSKASWLFRVHASLPSCRIGSQAHGVARPDLPCSLRCRTDALKVVQKCHGGNALAGRHAFLMLIRLFLGAGLTHHGGILPRGHCYVPCRVLSKGPRERTSGFDDSHTKRTQRLDWGLHKLYTVRAHHTDSRSCMFLNRVISHTRCLVRRHCLERIREKVPLAILTLP